MTKKELINRIRISESMTQEQTTRIVNNIFNLIANEVVKGNDVYISKFGRFYRSKVDQKRCIHPETKKAIIIPAHNVVRLRMAENLKRKLKGK